MNSLFQTVLLAITLSSTVIAHPSTHSTHSVGRRATLIQAFHPPTKYETFGAGIDHILSKRQDASLKESAIAVIEEKTGTNSSQVAYKTGYSSSTGEFAYARQKHNGIEFANSGANVAFKDNKLVAFGSSFVHPTSIASATPSVSVTSAVAKAESILNGKLDTAVQPVLEYLAKADGSAVLTFVLRISNVADFKFYQAYVNAHSGELESVVNFVSELTYRVVPITKQNVAQASEDVVDPEDSFSSPEGWTIPNEDGVLETAGNNVASFAEGAVRTVQSGPEGFLYGYNVTKEPNTPENIDAARTNTFYIVNKLHDIWYRYGFTEEAFNFQNTNFGKGGAQGDRVQVSAQDPLTTDNALFATFPDGLPGLMRMFIWTQTTPYRDGDLSNDIVVHEYTHGLTNRKVGGGSASCLQTDESGGMGEGWSDAMAEWVIQKSDRVEDYVTGAWVLNNKGGIRRYPYSIDPKVNPLKYSSIPTSSGPHQVGEIWANMLHNVYYQLVTKYGFSPDAFTKADGTEGNVVWAHLFHDSLSLMPCNPTFAQARDAWIQADANRYDGVNRCLLWNVFASRGLGLNATADYIDDETVPKGCA